MECPTANSLFDDYARASVKYFEAVSKLSDLVGSHSKFEQVRLCARQRYAKCKAARSALNAHRVEHNCRKIENA